MAEELKLDLSGLTNGGTLIPPELHQGEDNFAGKYRNMLKVTKPVGQSVQIDLNEGKRLQAFSIVTAINENFEKRRKEISWGLQDYLIEHDGKVGCWPSSKETSTYSYEHDPSKTEYVFDYFGSEYEVSENSSIYSPRYLEVYQKKPKVEYKNHYSYTRPEPLKPDALKNMEEEYRHLLVDDVQQARERVDDAKKVLSEERSGSRLSGFFGLLFSLIWILIWVLPCIHPVHPIDYEGMEGWTASIGDWINTVDVPDWARVVLTVLGYIPMLLTYFFAAIEKVLTSLMEWVSSYGTGGYVGGIAVCAVLCLIGLAFINCYVPAWDLVRPSKKKECREWLDYAEKALEDIEAEQARKKDEYAQREDYKKLKAEYEAKLKAYEEDKAMNEAFAEQWQRAWYDFIISAQ